MKKLDQRGTGALAVLALLILIGMVGFTGWYVYHSKNNITSPTANTQTEITQPKAKEQKYLKVPELGVEFVIPDSLPSLTYNVGKSYEAKTKAGNKTTVKYVVLVTSDNKDKNAVENCGPEGQQWLGGLYMTEPNTLTGMIGRGTWEEYSAESEFRPGKLLGDKFYTLDTIHVCSTVYSEAVRNEVIKSVHDSLKLSR